MKKLFAFLLLGVFLISFASAFDWESNINSYYKVDNIVGIVVDSVGNLDGISVGVQRGVDGIINKAFNFSSDYVNVDTVILDYGTATFNFWFNTTSSLRGGIIGNDMAGKNDDMVIELDNGGGGCSAGEIIFSRQDDDLDINIEICSDVALNDGDWHMVTSIFNSTGMFMYVDGVIQADTDPFSEVSTNQDGWVIGSNGLSILSRNYTGLIDEIGIWNISLSESSVTELYNNGNGITYKQREPILNSPEDGYEALLGENIIFNVTANGINNELINMSLYINDTLNETKSLSGIEDTETFTKSFSILGGYNWSVEVCDNESTCTFSSVREFSVNNFIVKSVTFNSTSFETAEETFTINVSGATAATLNYNGTTYTTTRSGNIFTRTIQIPVGQIGNNSIHWVFNGVEDSQTYYQIISETVFILCNATYTTNFLNISFKDESDLEVINATIPTSTFVYYLGDGTTTKTLTFINNSVNFNYEFCATPNRTLTVNSLIQFKQGSAYPQRIFSQTGASLTNTTTNLTLYLLSVSDGLFVTFQVFGGQSAALEGVNVGGTRILEGSAQSVAQGTTDAAGTVTFWLNPDFLHTFTYAKTGFETVIESLFPTQTLYTITMGSGAVAGINNTAEGVHITILPQGSFLDKNTFYTFTYKINSSSLDLDEFGFELFYNNGTSIHSDSSTLSTGGILDKSFNTTNQTRILMTYYYITDGERINGSTYWLIYEPSDFSIYHFLTRVGTYISADMFGILGDDEGYFAKAMLSILVLILVTGSISFRYGLGSEAAVTGLLFGVIFMLNMFNLIPTPDFLTFIELGDFLVFVVAIVTVSRILKEERR